MNNDPVSREHQQWRNFKASSYVQDIDTISAALKDITMSGAKLSIIDMNKLRFLAGRLNAIAKKAEEEKAA